MEIESCSAAWREARRKEDWPVCADRRIKERGRWELARSVVSEQRDTREVAFFTPRSTRQKDRRRLLGSGRESTGCNRSFCDKIRPAKPRIVSCASSYLFLAVY